jgi:hypothetical protein
MMVFESSLDIFFRRCDAADHARRRYQLVALAQQAAALGMPREGALAEVLDDLEERTWDPRGEAIPMMEPRVLAVLKKEAEALEASRDEMETRMNEYNRAMQGALA